MPATERYYLAQVHLVGCCSHPCSPAVPLRAFPSGSVFDELFGGLLTPDEVVFAVLLRGYGGAARPNWNEISSCLAEMEGKHGITPSTGVGRQMLHLTRHNAVPPVLPAAAAAASEVCLPPPQVALEARPCPMSTPSQLELHAVPTPTPCPAQ